MAGALGGDHEHVEIGARVQQVEMHVQPVREGKGGARLHVGREIAIVDVGLQLIGRQHHDDVGPLGAVRRTHHREARALGLLDRG
jgi:hypothetical protein